jgi:hypothetical protein
MNNISTSFINGKKYFAVCAFCFFWISNIGPLLSGKTIFLRLLIYPLFLVLLVILSIHLFNVKKSRFGIDNISYNLLLILVVLGCLCVGRGITLYMDIDTIRSMLFDLFGAVVVWLVPLFMVYSVKGQFWVEYLSKLRLIVLVGLLYIFMLFLTGMLSGDVLQHKVYNSADLLFIAPFLIIWSRFKKDSFDLIIGCLGVTGIIVWMFFFNERYAIAYTGLMCLMYLFLIIFEKYKLNLKINLITLILFMVIIFGGFFSQVSIFKSYIDRYIYHGEILIDTRGGGSLNSAVTQDMTAFEKYFGKGINGTYIWGKRGWPPRPYIRSGVEIGYKQLVLKGGYFMQSVFLVFSFYAVFLAIFRSNNRVTRYLACIIIARLIVMITAMPPRVGFEYFMYWLVIGGCLSSELRSFSDADILSKAVNKRIVIKW